MVRIENILIRKNRVSATAIVNNEINEVWYEFPEGTKLSKRPANALMLLFLPVAMHFGGTLKIEGEVSSELYENLKTYQDIMMKWYPYMKRVKIVPNKVVAGGGGI